MKKRGPKKKPRPPQKRKDPGAVRLGRRGADARQANTTAEQRSEIARRAANSRWGNAADGGESPVTKTVRDRIADPSFGKAGKRQRKSVIVKPKADNKPEQTAKGQSC